MLWNMYLPKDAQWVKKGSKNTADDMYQLYLALELFSKNCIDVLKLILLGYLYKTCCF